MFDDVKELKIGDDKITMLKLGDDVVYPQGLVLYDYLQTTGNSWINTEVLPNKITLKIECKYNCPELSKWIFGGRVSSSGAGICLFSLSTLYYSFCTNSVHMTGNSVGNHTVVISKDGLYLDGVYTCKNTGSTLTTYPIWLFALNQGGSPDSRIPTQLQMFYFKVWDEDTLIRNMIPCTYNSEAGMYDLVEGKFYSNSGTGTFVVG